MESISYKNIKPLTKRMQEELMEYHERELLKQEPSPALYSKGSSGLLSRELIGVKSHTRDGRVFDVFKITSLGIYYLSKLV